MNRAHVDRVRNSSSATAGSPELTLRADIVHVVAGVVRDASGRILLTQRPQGKHLAGLWEFPGGKREAGETPQAALRRELREEIGIDAGTVQRLISYPWHYAEKSIFLDVYDVLDFQGEASGCEGQATRWELAETMGQIAMPAADVAIVSALRLPDRYVITPEPDVDDDLFLSQLNHVLTSGAKLVQLRSKHRDPDRLLAITRRARACAHAAGAKLLLNGHIDIVDALKLDGVHLPASEFRAMTKRPLDDTFLVGVSAHGDDDMRHAVAIAADFAVLGPIHKTATHPAASTLGWDGFAHLVNEIALPVYALGGLTPSDLSIARSARAQGIAGISAFWKDQRNDNC